MQDDSVLAIGTGVGEACASDGGPVISEHCTPLVL